MARHSAADTAKRMLHGASLRLDTADPVGELGREIEDSLPYPPGDGAYRRRRVLEPSFSELAPGSLSLFLETGGPGASPSDRLDTSLSAVRRLVGKHFGREALSWLDGRTEGYRGRGRSGLRWGSRLGAGFDHEGMREALIALEWGSGMQDTLPAGLYRIAEAALAALPQLRPMIATMRCGRSSGSQQLTFDVDGPLPLADLQPLMDRLGLGGQHPALMSAAAFALGARFTLPPESATLTLRPVQQGVEMRLDVALEAVPDAPSQLISLLRLQMTERPAGVKALDRWLMALTPQGFAAPGEISVLSFTVRGDTPPRLSIHLQPVAITRPEPVAAPRPEHFSAASAGIDPGRRPAAEEWLPWPRA